TDRKALSERVNKAISGNAAYSPAELFAQQFEMYATRKMGGPAADENYWKRVVNYVKSVFDRYVHGVPIDPDLEPLFAKILPDEDAAAFGLGRDVQPSTEAGKVYNRRYMELRTIREDLERSIKDDSPDAIIQNVRDTIHTLLTLAPRVHAADKRGTTGTLMPLLRIRTIIRQRIDDLSEILSGKPFDFDGWDEKEALPGWMIDEGLTAIDDPSAASDLLRDFYVNGYTGDFKPSRGVDSRIKNMNATSLSKLFDMMEKTLEGAYKKAESGNLPTAAKPRLDGDDLPPAKASKTVKKAKAKKDRIEGASEAAAIKAAKTPAAKRPRRDPKKARPVDPALTESLQEKSKADLRRMYLEHRGTDRGDQIAVELLRKVRAEPIKPEKFTEIPVEVKNMKGEELERMMLEAFEAADNTSANQAISEISRRALNKLRKKENLKILQPRLLKREFIEREISDNLGVATNDGVPPATRASIRELLGYITHRDADVQASARTMTYRMLNLMNKTTREVMGETNVMSSQDMARLTGLDVNTVGTAAFADFREPAFKKLRSDMRRMSIALNKGTANPFDIMHELGHMMVRSGVMDEMETAAIREAYDLSTDINKTRVQRRYGKKYADRTEPLDELLAEEWFAENLAVYMAERVAKGDVLEAAIEGNLGNLRLRNSFSRAMDRAIEYIAYVLNGLVGRNDIKQQYRRLFLFGDMFEKADRAPLSSVLRRNKAVHSSYAADAVSDHIYNSPQARLDKIRQFVGRGISFDEETGSFIEYYHGTPNGWAFNKDKNPDVVLGGSKRGVFGPGIYLTKAASIADSLYSRKPTFDALKVQINKLRDEGKFDEETEFFALHSAQSLNYARHETSQARRQYSQMIAENAKRSDLARQKERIDYLIYEEEELVNELAGYGVQVEPMVIPTFVNVQSPADFRMSARYVPNEEGTPDALPSLLIAIQNMNGGNYFNQRAYDEYVLDIASNEYNGRELYDRMLKVYNDRFGDDGDLKLSEDLEDQGYDGLLTTHRNTLDIVGTEEMPSGGTYEAAMTHYDAVVVFDSANVKHVDAAEFDDYDNRLFYRAEEALPRGTVGEITESLMSRDFQGMGDINPGSVGEVLEERGVSSPMSGAIMSMLRGRKLNPKEEQAVRKTSPFWWLQSQSARMDDLGAKWVGSWYKDNFPKLHRRFASKYFPIHHKLRELPDADGKVRAWARRASAGVKQEQPKSYQRIVKALRYGAGSQQQKNLSEQETKVWQQIRNAFAEERRQMISMGIYVGDRGPNYLPQVWNKEKILGNKDRFLAEMRQYFKVEKTAKGIVDYTDEQADDFARGILATLTEDGADGVFVPIQGGSRNPKFENVDFSRIIELEKYPAMLRRLEPFLEDDLEGLLVKYFEGSSRRMQHVEKMGVNSHAFYDYMMIAEVGKPGIVRLLSTAKDFRKDVRAIGETGYPEYATLSEVVAMPFEGKEGMAVEFVENLTRVHNEQGAGAARQMLDTIAVRDADGNIPIAYKRRADAIIGALDDFGGQKANWKANDYEFMENALRVAMKKPQTGTGSRGMMNFSKAMRSFNSVSLLGFTTLTSLGDLALPIIRSGSFSDWSKAMYKMSQDPEYRQFIYDAGVAMENIVHERMVHMYGATDGKLSNAFFNATMLTPWTDMNRHIAGAVGYEAFKTQQRRAFAAFKEGVPLQEQSIQYKTAHRFLYRYGLQDYLPEGNSKHLDLGDRKLMAEDDALAEAMIKFADESIFQPNPNDIPLWAQTPWGAMIFQLKSFPLMMTRLSKHVVDEAMKGNVKPLAYFATLGPAFGMGALAIKDIVQMRGGDDERSPELRRRNLLKVLGYDEKVHGNEQDFLGWYVEGMIMMGGLGLIGDVMHSAATQVDNGAYGKVRIASTVAGPTFGAFMSGIDVAAGAKDAIAGGDNSNAKERTAVREAATRIPVLGGIRAAREGIVDTLAGEPSSSRKKNPWQSTWNNGGWK
ncbi:MAG: hypothetical protein EBV86_00840, partial [Marivivens sp.]|nr:hypothetical protein [Marivivens sp.]